MDTTFLKISHSEIIVARDHLHEQHYFKINIKRDIAVITLMFKTLLKCSNLVLIK